MSRYWKRRNSHSYSKKDEEYIKKLLFAAGVFIFVFPFSFVGLFFKNCVFEWPIRWDVTVCWNEQIAPAKERALNIASLFI